MLTKSLFCLTLFLAQGSEILMNVEANAEGLWWKIPNQALPAIPKNDKNRNIIIRIILQINHDYRIRFWGNKNPEIRVS